MKKLFKTSQEIIDWLNNGFKQDSLQSEIKKVTAMLIMEQKQLRKIYDSELCTENDQYNKSLLQDSIESLRQRQERLKTDLLKTIKHGNKKL
ncbi:hypothetical protein [Winogradskyella sp. KYW1333]|uniref:hypothetical protein n=1 Tax=Winogradskyella sp. KYW1333 TaxID=2282123 RepID=UPI000DF1AC84|nr:hypothetical protein [Winogradskyella sp. KYW1333]RCT56397.1 hypothetical protein DUZ96_00605 [Winogradskyella sp. KYW1333]